MSEAKFTADLDGTVDYGNIDNLSCNEEAFNISGDFGSVEVTCTECNLEFSDA